MRNYFHLAGSQRRRRVLLGGLALLALALSGCAFGQANQRVQLPRETAEAVNRPSLAADGILRPPIDTSQNLYEGSLWRGAASWGNLLRDHRARYRGDLLTVINLQKIIKVPETKSQQTTAQQAANAQTAQSQTEKQKEKEKEALDPVLAFLRAQEKARQAIEREQDDILGSIQSIEVEVVRVLPNGNMQVRGVHPPVFRDRNNVKYVVTLEGIVRPSDVDENNDVDSTRLSKAEVKIHRYVRRSSLPLGDVARAAGRPQQGELLDRLTSFLTGPGTGNRTTQANLR